MSFKSYEWYLDHPEVTARHHRQFWSELQIKVLVMLFEKGQHLEEMARMLGRTEYGVLAQLGRQKLIWWDKGAGCYRFVQSDRRREKYDGKKFR